MSQGCMAIAAAAAALAVAAAGAAPSCRVTAVAAGSETAAAIDVDGTVWTWGWWAAQGTNRPVAWPAPLSGPISVEEISAGDRHLLARTNDSSLWAWGDDCYGGLGDGPPLDCPSVPIPILVGSPGSWDQVDACSAGAFSLGIATDGSVWWWGTGPGYEVLDGPVSVPDLSGASAVAAGGSAFETEAHGLAVVGGSVWAWGDGLYGALGDGTETSSATPVEVQGLTAVVAVTAGYQYSLALRDDGSVWAWGLNDRGQLGDGTNLNSSVPVPLNLPAAATAVSAGLAHSLALLADGTVMAWGLNDRGQLGDETTVDSSVPVAVSGLAGVTAIAAAASDNSFAVLADGTLRVWGDSDAATGRGIPPNPPQPLLVPTLIDFDAVPPDQGNVLRAARQGEDVVLDWEAGQPEFGAMGATLWRIYSDPTKDTLGTSALPPDTTEFRFVDAGAITRPGIEYYRIRGLSRCTLTPGP